MDGKERVKLKDGSQVSWMNIGDEGSGAHLAAIVHPERLVAEIDLQDALQGVNKCFKRWGVPQQIKIDNGLPFVNPYSLDVPTKAKLWWIGLGINVIQNTVRCPQENGIVEGLQGVMCSWSNPKAQPDAMHLQKRLDEESDFQRNHYQIPGRGRKTRKELYPELEKNSRQYRPENFDIKRVYLYLSNQVWQRKVKSNGEVKVHGSTIYIGKRFAPQTITLTFDPIEIQWVFRKTDGTLLKTSKEAIPMEKEIFDFATMSMNSDTT